MATVESDHSPSTATAGRHAPADAVLPAALRTVLKPLSSLWITVVLFALAVFLVFAGTLAQRFYGVRVPTDDMFRSLLAWIELRFFFPMGSVELSPKVKFPFPGGWTLGGLLMINLLAAHAVQFKMTARGTRRLVGWAVLAAGAAATYAVIRSGLTDTLLSQLSPQFANGLWHALRAALGGGALALAWVVAVTWSQARNSNAKWLWSLGAITAAILLALTVALFFKPQWRLDDSGLRIMWQLIKGLGASGVLLAGCWLLFGKRAGVVLLHGGVALLMASELHTGLTAVESQMQIAEGQAVSFAEDMRSVELAIVDKSDPQTDRVIRVPEELLIQAAESPGMAIADPQLPFSLRVIQYLPNSEMRWLQSDEVTVATAGVGQLRTVDSLDSSVGVDAEQRFDKPAAYVELIDTDAEKSLGTYLLQVDFFPQAVASVDGGPYEAALRYKRVEKPYSVQLLRLTAEQYVGSNTAKHYESLVRLTDPAHDVDREIEIWMNNPLRYSGDTLYQSEASVIPGGRSVTGLQVTTNSGWLVPYLACVIVGVGMFAHFGLTLARFIRRRDEEARRAASDEGGAASPFAIDRSLRTDWRLPQVWVPALLVVVAAAWMASKARAPEESIAEFHINEFAELPVVAGGRVQPFDSLARNTLMILSGKDTYDDGRTTDDDERLPASQWLLEVASGRPGWEKHPVIRIENLDVLQTLGLERRSGFRYSFAELFERAEKYDQQTRLARQALTRAGSTDQLELTQVKFLELSRKVRQLTTLIEVFGTVDFAGSSRQAAIASLERQRERITRLNQRTPPVCRPLPPARNGDRWRTLLEGEFRALIGRETGSTAGANPGLALLRGTLDAYADGSVGQFNERLTEYQQWIDERAAAEAAEEDELQAAGKRGVRKFVERLAPGRLAWETAYNGLDLFDACKAFYIAAFVLAAAAWLGWTEGLNRSANWLLWLTFGLHTVALVARVYISGRPPVTNLYSSAVFIGWAAVLFSLVFEIVYRMGVGNLLAAAVGFPSLVIASRIADGDTFTVMQAVLDTQFWLATHVVCISLGYTTTFLAGFLGLFWLVLGWTTNVLGEKRQRHVTRMTYGTLCFAIFFSFVGTVLGGLWADDSWGRFWGWDPKENGALMIVLWNALVLHARWGKLVGPRGLAVLAVCGNIVTSWSWFGVNQLGVGLHAYGETSGVTVALFAFAGTQLIVMALAWLPRRDLTGPNAIQ